MTMKGWVQILVLWVLFLGAMSGCTGPGKKAKRAQRDPLVFQVTPAAFSGSDDADIRSLKAVLKSHIQYWKQQDEGVLRFGESHSIGTRDYLRSLQKIQWVLEKEGISELLSYLSNNFVFLSVKEVGVPAGSAFFTSYFEPLLDDRFWQPLYETPRDMVVVDMEAWAQAFPRWSVWQNRSTEKKSASAVLRGRLISDTEGQLPRILPYWSREEIDAQGVMHKNAQILAYLDPIDSFFLQIQGSGALKFKDGKVLRVGYAAQNGHPYTAIGKFMFSVIPRSKMSLQAIEEYLRRLPAGERQSFLNRNASYVFFRKLKGRGETYMGTEVVDGRTIATDTSYYPKGTLAWISIPGVEVSGQSISRFVMDQDTGGAIRGAGRVDLFWGQGEEAKKAAGGVKHKGELFYLFPQSALGTVAPMPTQSSAGN